MLYTLPSPKVYLAGNFDMAGWWRGEGNQARLQQAMEEKGLRRVSSVSVLAYTQSNLFFIIAHMLCNLFNRPGEAGAVLQTPLLLIN